MSSLKRGNKSDGVRHEKEYLEAADAKAPWIIDSHGALRLTILSDKES